MKSDKAVVKAMLKRAGLEFVEDEDNLWLEDPFGKPVNFHFDGDGSLLSVHNADK